MWILECPGELLQGKRLWLKPGKNYLFGRVKKDGVRFAIDHKTVSRQHFVIEVSEPSEAETTQIHARTKITIIDQKSKSGTYVNGELCKDSSKELKKDINSIRPGNIDDELVVRWQPCVLTWHLLKKEIKIGLLKKKQGHVRHLGIKVVADFMPDSTTHVVVNKRNTPKGLQALVCGKYLVTEAFVDAIEVAATPSDLDADESQSPLESDFDASWPAARDYLPSPGREPTIRPVETYQPGADRTQIFENYTFVFGDKAQYDNLLPVITTGHGKTLLFNIVNGETTAEEAVKYLQNVAGHKEFGERQSRQEKGGVVMVRWNPPDEFSDWGSRLISQIALKLDQRVIDQSEFLDAVLANDASLLRQTVPHESTTEGIRAPPPTAASSKQRSHVNGHLPTGQTSQATKLRGFRSTEPSQVVEFQGEEPSHEPQPEAKRRRFRMPPPTQPKPKFDDGFDDDAIVAYNGDGDDAAAPSHLSKVEESPAAKGEAPSTTKKRRRSPSAAAEESFDHDMDDLLPAAAAMKRRRLEIEAEARRTGKSLPASALLTAPKSEKPRKKVEEIDVRALARAERERKEAEARVDDSDNEHGSFREQYGGKPANLVIVEHLELPVRHNRPAIRQQPEDDPRWDPRWTGRKNFKKFSPQDGSKQASDRATRVLVPLVEVAMRKDGLGEQYWDKTEEEKERQRKRREKEKLRKASQSQTQGRSQVAGVEVNDSDDQDAVEVANGSASASDEPVAARKRPASRAATTSAPNPKRQKTLPVNVVHGSDSEGDSDDMKFRFGKGRKAKK